MRIKFYIVINIITTSASHYLMPFIRLSYNFYGWVLVHTTFFFAYISQLLLNNNTTPSNHSSFRSSLTVWNHRFHYKYTLLSPSDEGVWKRYHLESSSQLCIWIKQNLLMCVDQVHAYLKSFKAFRWLEWFFREKFFFQLVESHRGV